MERRSLRRLTLGTGRMKIWPLAVFWGLWYLGFAMRIFLSPLLPIIEEELAINHATAGALFLFFYVGSALSLATAGFAARRIGNKRVIVIGSIVSAATLIGLINVRSYLPFSLLLFVLGVSSCFYSPCALSMLTSIFDKEHWGKVIAVHETAPGFGFLSIPVIIAGVLAFFPWRAAPALLSGAMFLMGLAFWVTMPDAGSQPERNFDPQVVFKRRDFQIMAVVWISGSLSVMAVYNIIPLFLVSERGLSVEYANQLFSFSRIGGFAATVALGLILDRVSPTKILFLLVLTTGLSTVGIAVAQTTWQVVFMLFLQATFGVVFFPVAITVMARLTNIEERSVFMGVIMALSSIVSLGCGPVALGVIADAFSFQKGILLFGLLSLSVLPLIKLLDAADAAK